MLVFESWQAPLIYNLTLSGLQIFFLVTVSIALWHFHSLFLDRHGWSHRLAGGLHLGWLVYGCLTLTAQLHDARFALWYDICLGCLGLTATVRAAKDFPHRYVRNHNGQSGTLSEKAMVTQGEMMEHAFYQFLNLWQALFLHLMAAWNGQLQLELDWRHQWIALWCVTAPWYVRSCFPVHSFSQNWSNQPTPAIQKRSDLETSLYKVKKAQYLFYKHVVLHGVNLAAYLEPSPLVRTRSWRLFWLCLNTAYVMEFFLQSLVRRKVLRQSSMLWLNRLLMAVSSLAAIPAIFRTVRWELCLASLFLNFYHRHHDVMNTMGLGSVALFLSRT